MGLALAQKYGWPDLIRVKYVTSCSRWDFKSFEKEMKRCIRWEESATLYHACSSLLLVAMFRPCCLLLEEWTGWKGAAGYSFSFTAKLQQWYSAQHKILSRVAPRVYHDTKAFVISLSYYTFIPVLSGCWFRILNRILELRCWREWGFLCILKLLYSLYYSA